MACQVCRASAQLHFPHQKFTIFNAWIVRRSFCNKFIARQGKSTDNTLCIIEHFDTVLRRIYRKNRTPFESPMAKSSTNNGTEMLCAWFSLSFRRTSFCLLRNKCDAEQNLPQQRASIQIQYSTEVFCCGELNPALF